MKLSKRLQVIASLVPENVRVIDVGCDHALLDIYLTLYQKNLCVASDISENVLLKTKEMIRKYHLENKIEVVKSDGFKSIELKKEDVVVIAGMGTSTILHILEEKSPEYLIIDSHNHLELLRREVTKKGYVIENEELVFENGIYYVIMFFKRGSRIYTEKEYLYGPILITKKSKLVKQYFHYLLEKRNHIVSKQNEPSQELLKEITYLNELL